ncbi:MAG: glutamate--tRNA ligase [Candidatus Anammoxibacter sp.]
MTNPSVRVRFAPSPTGCLHIGGVRTALYNWLFARNNGGKFFLRIEDTDRVRSTQESTDVIFENLKWLGFDWDEEPRFQSKRIEIYNKHVEKLLSDGMAYEIEGGAVTFKVQQKEMLEFDDAVLKKISFDPSLIEDFVIRKTDGFPVYNFACVVDDADMEITHVIRGDDHTSNTPRQLLLYNALGIKPPVFAHIPMILGEDGARLSKRHGATSVADYRERGYLPEALLNFLALLGWSPGNDQELLTIDEMVEKFSLERVNKTSARFDNTKFDWMNGQYIMNMKTEEVVVLLKPFIEEANIDFDSLDREWLLKLIDLYHDRLKTLNEFTEKTSFFFSDNIHFNDKAVKKFLQKEAAPGSKSIGEILGEVCSELSLLEDFRVEHLEVCLKSLLDKFNIGFAKLAQPIRVAISGDSVSASIFETLELLGKEKTLDRIQYVIKTFCTRSEVQGSEVQSSAKTQQPSGG